MFRVDASIYFLYKIAATLGDATNYEDTTGEVCFLDSSGHCDYAIFVKPEMKQTISEKATPIKILSPYLRQTFSTWAAVCSTAELVKQSSLCVVSKNADCEY